MLKKHKQALFHKGTDESHYLQLVKQSKITPALTKTKGFQMWLI